MKINKMLAVLIGVIFIMGGYSISFIIPRHQEIKIIVPQKNTERKLFINIQLNKTFVPLGYGFARMIKLNLSELKKPYQKSEIDRLLKGLNAISFFDSNKCGVFLMNSEIDKKFNVYEDFYITPDTIYMIDTYRPVLFKYIVKNDKGGYDTLNELP